MNCYAVIYRFLELLLEYFAGFISSVSECHAIDAVAWVFGELATQLSKVVRSFLGHAACFQSIALAKGRRF